MCEALLVNGEEKPVTAALYASHFKAMLRFQLDHLDFLKAIDKDFGYQQYYNSVLEYVEENGVKTYGLLLMGSPKDLLAFCKNDFVCKIMLDDMAFSRWPQAEP